MKSEEWDIRTRSEGWNISLYLQSEGRGVGCQGFPVFYSRMSIDGKARQIP